MHADIESSLVDIKSFEFKIENFYLSPITLRSEVLYEMPIEILLVFFFRLYNTNSAFRLIEINFQFVF